MSVAQKSRLRKTMCRLRRLKRETTHVKGVNEGIAKENMTVVDKHTIWTSMKTLLRMEYSGLTS